MPELPEVEAVVRKLRAAAPWSEIVSHGQLRATTMEGARRAVGRRVECVERRGKNILIRLSGDAFLRVHLKMTGNLAVLPDWRLRPATIRGWFGLADGRALALDDPRALGRVGFHEAVEEAGLFEDLGPEPFSAEFSAEHFVQSAKRTSKPVKLLLMEQRAVVGLGNIYAAEALFQAGIHPRAAAGKISKPRLVALHRAIVEVLKVALDSAVTAFEQPGGFTEGESYRVAVYGREGEQCLRCTGTIRRIPQGGRSTYYCPGCQK